ncbi:MAG: glycosyltransferase family 2 protein [Myxococcales bacterium]|nr:glycosyltransferase family 2 protein [Deltaproteobacteria bacterium]MBT8481373.1 glycosyltransferase family 2 protein [Deltaproteobacteria bacterium]NNK06991.1 glycosyltransferase family 2 protein [Myxococcales bacterium]NNK42083.1 glycosyltransferase family 2 protein [Myxococcales bacterium]NNL24236.1 glycosyltransferase family 2 protein [Myxococcales bacterium]
MQRPALSLIIPVYNEEEIIAELDRRLKAFLAEVDETWEVLFVDDGSQDGTSAALGNLASAEPRYKVISFSRNFGHQIAITAGMDRAEGDAVVIMDADLQDPPEVVTEMIQKWREGYDVVYGQRSIRHGESVFKRATAAAFYRVMRALMPIEMPLDAGDFRLMSRSVVLSMRALREQHRFVRAMVSWVGFKQTAVRYERSERFAGETKYPLRKMIRFAIDGITSFSIVPLRVATWLGLLSGLVAIVTSAWALYAAITEQTVPGWATIMIAVALAASAQLIMTGVLGEYIGRIYEEVKRRPLYVVADTMNLPPSDPSSVTTEAAAAPSRRS